jgi:hypothetical protein
MRTLAIMAASLGLVGTMAVGTAVPAAADWYGHHHRYYNYGGCVQSGTCCPPGYTVQGGRCAPYHYGPWDLYGGRHGYYRY